MATRLREALGYVYTLREGKVEKVTAAHIVHAWTWVGADLVAEFVDVIIPMPGNRRLAEKLLEYCAEAYKKTPGYRYFPKITVQLRRYSGPKPYFKGGEYVVEVIAYKETKDFNIKDIGLLLQLRQEELLDEVTLKSELIKP